MVNEDEVFGSGVDVDDDKRIMMIRNKNNETDYQNQNHCVWSGKHRVT